MVLQSWRKGLITVLALHGFTPTDIVVAVTFSYAWNFKSFQIPDEMLVSHSSIREIIMSVCQVQLSRRCKEIRISPYNLGYASDGSHKRGLPREDTHVHTPHRLGAVHAPCPRIAVPALALLLLGCTSTCAVPAKPCIALFT